MSNLEENSDYFFVVRAFDTYGNESSDSNEITLRYQHSGTDPTLDNLSITGPDWVVEGFTADYEVVAKYTDGTNRTIADGVNWSTDSTYASISPGWVLTTSPVPETQVVTFTASFTENGVDFETVALDIIIVDEEENGDIDHDGMPDWWENVHGLDRFSDDSIMDPDGDLFSNLDEFINETDPGIEDTDNDGLMDGLEVPYGYDPDDPNSRPHFPLLEFGEVLTNHTWKTVSFKDPFLDPIVVAKSLSHNGGQPAVIRIGDLDQNGFAIRVQEWEYLGGWHKTETVGYLVAERGNYTLPNGAQIEINRFETDRFSPFVQVMFNEPFQSIPVVIASVSTYNDAATVTGRLRSIDTHGFEFTLQEQELGDGYRGIETISFVAWEKSSGNVDGVHFEVYDTDNVVSHKPYRILFDQDFAAPPAFLADMQTAHGQNTASLRWENKDPFGVDVLIEEERSYDVETRHKTEVVGYMVFCNSMSGSSCLP